MKFINSVFGVFILLLALVGTTLFASDIVKNAQSTTNDMLVAQVNTDRLVYGQVQEQSDGGSGSTRKAKEGIGAAASRRLKIINLGSAINSSSKDYAPTVTADGKLIYFVSDRAGSKELPNGNNSTDFWAFKKQNPKDTIFTGIVPYNIDITPDADQTGVNTVLNEGVASISQGGRSLFFTGCNRPNGFGDCDIYTVRLDGDKWQKPINLGKNINTEYFESQPSVAPGGKRLYFASTRPGPNSSGENIESEMDIWYSDWDDDADDWKPARNLEAINTKGKDCSPYICADGKSLIFSSDRSGGYGGLDFYVTYYNNATNSWSAPENLGKPLNTSGDDQFITLNADLDVIYFSSTRSDISGNQGELDLYMGWVPFHPRTSLITGNVVDDCSGDLVDAEVSITNKTTGKKVDNIYDTKTQSFSYTVTFADFGDAEEATFEITSIHPKFGNKTVTEKVKHYPDTDDEELAKKNADTHKIRIPIGDRPSLVPVIAESEYVAKSKGRNPKIANFRGLVMEEILNWSLYPLLTYVFFDEGSAVLPSRYQLFKSPDATRVFTDSTISGGTLSKYYHILNIFGFRLNTNPNEKLEIVGCNDGVTAAEKTPGLSKSRADVVFNYLRDVWNIAPERMKVTARDQPANPSNKTDSLGKLENRRVELICSEWEVFKPIFDKDVSKLPQPDEMQFQLSNGIEDAIVASRKIVIKHGDAEWLTITNIGTNKATCDWDWTNKDGEYPTDNVSYTAQLFVTTKSGAVCTSDPIEIPVLQVSTQERIIATGEGKTKEDYSLILFPFNSADAGPVNERVMRDYVYGRVFPTTDILVTGHTDIVGLFDYNVKLSERRATTVKNGIQKQSGGKFKSMLVKGVGPETPLYPNDLPEGRFYNRTVHVQMESTITSE
ncbi:MAG: OmpA family protein [Ignavibacteria bacterium]|jgi:outer membrane protein OmpA-like peptidoglycan-associated protein|nr:OmpA family protein [Ignavibacteria bacterium]